MESFAVAEKEIRIAGIKVKTGSFEEIVEEVERLRRGWILSLNLEFFAYLHRERWLRELSDKSAFNIPDGVSVRIAIWRKHGVWVPRVTGIDLFLELLRRGKRKFFFLGSQKEVVEKAVTKAKEQFPTTEVAGWHSGYFCDEEKVCRLIQKSGADFLVLGMGIPRQERFIYQHYYPEAGITILTVGGGIDILGGKVKRAPVWMQNMGMEWLYRIGSQPSRTIRFIRSFHALPLLLIHHPDNDYPS
ncbi:MAG: WecB/TagA/CpsF family glycosyltransferase [bacterium JZ-2024 1]